MTKSRFLKHIGMSVVGVSIFSGNLQAEPVMAKVKSPHFDAVSSRLEMGGLSFSYTDQGGKNGFYRELIDVAVAYLDTHTAYKGVDAEKLAKVMTLDAIVASGSSASQRDGFIHYRTFNYMPKEKSMYALAYTDAAASVGLNLAPSGADLVLEMHLNGAYDPNAEEKMYAALGPVGDMLKKAQAAQMADPKLQLWSEFSKGINSRFTFIGDLNPKGFKAAPGFPMSGELLISVTNAEKMWQMLKPMIQQQGVEVVENGVNQDVASPVPAGVWLPKLRYNSATKQLVIATSSEYLKLCEKSAKGEVASLAKDKEYLKLKDGLPESFSSMVYVSPTFSETALNLVEMFGVPQVEDEEYMRPAVKMLVQKLKASDVTKTGTIYVASPQKDGTLHVTNSPIEIPSVGTNATSMAVLGVGGSTLFVGAKYYKESANKAACVINLRTTQKAMRSVQNIDDHAEGAPLSWEMLVGKNKPLLEMPTCPSGGTYTLSPTFPGVGQAVLRCDCEGHAPNSTENW